MAGIYIHIPFCKTRCSYCDFYSTTRNDLKDKFVEVLCKELEMRSGYLADKRVETIYFGGGTPSQLSEQDFKRIFKTIRQCFDTQHCGEVTLEANPDDLTEEYVLMLREQPFDRLSIGIQTFHNETLKLVNRRHDAQTAIEAVGRCRQVGFDNFSIDLMYGLPGQTITRWQHDLAQALELRPPHISAYHLIYEEGTPLYKMLRLQQVHEVDEESSVCFFSTLMNTLSKAGYEHYEISNFCLPDKYSRHNTSYWQGIHYLGCGPSAHSFNGTTREWNTSSLQCYIEGIEKGKRAFEMEQLDLPTRYNEYIITSLRTMWGISIERLQKEFGEQFSAYCRQMAEPYIEYGKLEERNGAWKLTREGLFISDGIMRDLLWVKEE